MTTFLGRPIEVINPPLGRYSGSQTTHLFAIGKTTAVASLEFVDGQATLKVEKFFPDANYPEETRTVIGECPETPFFCDSTDGTIELGHVMQYGNGMASGCSIESIRYIPHQRKILVQVGTMGWSTSGGNLVKVFKQPIELFLEGDQSPYSNVHSALYSYEAEVSNDSWWSRSWWASFSCTRGVKDQSAQPLLADDLDWI
jgi:hypothetical protein